VTLGGLHALNAGRRYSGRDFRKVSERNAQIELSLATMVRVSGCHIRRNEAISRCMGFGPEPLVSRFSVTLGFEVGAQRDRGIVFLVM